MFSDYTNIKDLIPDLVEEIYEKYEVKQPDSFEMVKQNAEIFTEAFINSKNTKYIKLFSNPEALSSRPPKQGTIDIQDQAEYT